MKDEKQSIDYMDIIYKIGKNKNIYQRIRKENRITYKPNPQNKLRKQRYRI